AEPAHRRLPARGAGVARRAALPAHSRGRGAAHAPRRGRPVLVVVVAGAVLREGCRLADRLPPGHAAPGTGRAAPPGPPGGWRLDYRLATRRLARPAQRVEVGRVVDGTPLPDHSPVVVHYAWP